MTCRGFTVEIASVTTKGIQRQDVQRGVAESGNSDALQRNNNAKTLRKP